MIRSNASARKVTIRSVRPDDRDRIVAAFQALDPETVYRRFFAPKKELSARELQSVTEPGSRQVVLVATTDDGGRASIVALGQYACHGGSAHLAFVVAGGYRGQGIAGRMLRRLSRIARARGIARFEADVLEENAAMLSVFRRSAWPTTESKVDGVVHFTMLLDGVVREGQTRSPAQPDRTPTERRRSHDHSPLKDHYLLP